ncbi:hypothetical protein J4772_28615 [Cohnella sp. LGH]|uniref:BsuPI-related putative proteinase inhibitor n=1 Tax=Cohnella sp. LGH TaxID=1619153 RepID=UPI001AD958B2|nr:BsuPI-related putative proteinase inhibitor [Cohnella sp. LGH]QTH41467.1 hypothetical protein J4772_28615 [Cohnella sp. LGH]
MKLRLALLAVALGTLLLIVSCAAKKVDQLDPSQGTQSSLADTAPAAAEDVQVYKQTEAESLPLIRKQQPVYVQGLLQTKLQTKMDKDSVKLLFSLDNLSDRELKLTFGSGMRYDFAVYDSGDEEIYRWSNDKSFTQALIEMKLKPSDSIEFEEEWDWTDNQGDAVPNGIYTLRLSIAAAVELPDGQALDPAQLTAETDLILRR